METILDIVKNHVSVPEGAAYCLGMTDVYPTEISCPYHDDEDASMQPYDNHYHCPVCGATDDMTELAHVSRIFRENALHRANYIIDKMTNPNRKGKVARQTGNHGNDQKGN